MLWHASELEGYEVAAADGTAGTVRDLLFDDERWGVRWLVVDVGGWLRRHQVLVPTAAAGPPMRDDRRLPVRLSRKEVEESPRHTAESRVSRRAEAELHRHYGRRPYWESDDLPPLLSRLASGNPDIGTGMLFPPQGASGATPAAAGDKPGASHLRSIAAATRQAIHARDGDIGHVDDFLVDDQPWAIRYIVVDTGGWLPGRKVLISPQWIQHVDWSGRRIIADLTRDQIAASPPYEPARGLTRDDEARLHGHYGQPVYWS